jgi:hypothetical protein
LGYGGDAFKTFADTPVQATQFRKNLFFGISLGTGTLIGGSQTLIAE